MKLVKAKWYARRLISYVGRPRLIIQEKPVLMDSSKRCESPIFLAGLHRSGTTLVRRMFNSHPNIACPPESYFFSNFSLIGEDELARKGFEGFGLNSEEIWNYLGRCASQLHEAYRLMNGKERWADKTPQYVDRLESIDKMFGARANYVFIIRHPYDIAFSIESRGWRLVEHESIFEGALAYVAEKLEKLLRFELEVGERGTRLVYEELTADPQKALTAALHAIGEQYSDEMLRFHEKSHNYGVEDPVVRGTKAVNPSHENWKAWDSTKCARARVVLGELAEKLNYRF
ncbi:sulfotransferase [Devosia sp. BSSL-BM10]|uniref:Sulfotransferase n=1 Tax=Devosia litorisediminis TaxID=2829817 RepID=A0A942EAD0_9HYPH|nr:sulfotransferase [Devosia litorisediminis]MBS3848547.1 sulfotransferase [Devosia litorisediminis]